MFHYARKKQHGTESEQIMRYDEGLKRIEATKKASSAPM
jgi:hypothetical protein